MRKIWGAAGLAVVALALSACGSSGSSSASAGNTPAAQGTSAASSAAASPASPAASAGGSSLVAKTIGGKDVLTNAQGFTLYWFAPDTPTTSKCDGSCATYWPPVKGPVTAGAGVTGKLGTITRSDGTMQATYDGHPLYTYAGDTAPGQDKGNGINASGGLWYNVPVMGGAAPAATAKATSTSGGYGY